LKEAAATCLAVQVPACAGRAEAPMLLWAQQKTIDNWR
jgi:hypothetical protein